MDYWGLARDGDNIYGGCALSGKDPASARLVRLHIDGTRALLGAGVRDYPIFTAGEKGSTPGMVYGLAIARDIARSHGGDIQLASSPLGGLRATVRVPV